MGVRDIWKNYKVLIVMVPSLGLVHWGWYSLKANPLLHQNRELEVPEPAVVRSVSSRTASS